MSALEPGTARITHPDPGVEDAIVPAMAVPHWEQAGWRFVDGDREQWPDELRETGREGMVYIRNLYTGGTAFVPELPGHLRERGWVEVGSDDDQAAQVERLEDKTVEELREIARERGVTPLPTKKADLIAALSDEAQKPEQVDEAGAEEIVARSGPERDKL